MHSAFKAQLQDPENWEQYYGDFGIRRDLVTLVNAVNVVGTTLAFKGSRRKPTPLLDPYDGSAPETKPKPRRIARLADLPGAVTVDE